MATKKTAPDAAAFDPRSEAVVLEYMGSEAGEPHLLGIPSRDLTSADICRLVYARGVNEYDGEPTGPAHPDPEQPDQAKCAELVELLLSRKVNGNAVYARPDAAAPTEPAVGLTEPAKPDPAPTDAPTDEPTTPAPPAEPEV